MKQHKKPTYTKKGRQLTVKQIDVLRYIAHGLAPKEIVEAMNIKRNSLTDHLTFIRKKTNAQNRFQMALFAVKAGLVTINEVLAIDITLSLDEPDIELLGLIGRGWSNNQIAEELECSQGYIINRIVRLKKKTGLDRLHLAYYAIRENLDKERTVQ